MMKSWMVATAVLALPLVGLGGCMTPGSPELPAYAAKLAPGAGITSSGSGAGVFTFNPATRELGYTVTYKDLTGPATMAHIHGPAEPGANAGVVVPFAAAASPIVGVATLTEAQAAELIAGKYYVNIHTAANKGGEIRGQLKP